MKKIVGEELKEIWKTFEFWGLAHNFWVRGKTERCKNGPTEIPFLFINNKKDQDNKAWNNYVKIQDGEVQGLVIIWSGGGETERKQSYSRTNGSAYIFYFITFLLTGMLWNEGERSKTEWRRSDKMSKTVM